MVLKSTCQFLSVAHCCFNKASKALTWSCNLCDGVPPGEGPVPLPQCLPSILMVPSLGASQRVHVCSSLHRHRDHAIWMSPCHPISYRHVILALQYLTYLLKLPAHRYTHTAFDNGGYCLCVLMCCSSFAPCPVAEVCHICCR